MAIISQETWDKFSEEEKEKIRQKYKDLEKDKDCNKPKTDLNIWFAGRFVELEELFGEENLQPKPQIKTWADVEKNFPSLKISASLVMFNSDELGQKLIKKMTATAKIAKLIELGYGGMITEEEWRDDKTPKYRIVPKATEIGKYKVSMSFYIDDVRLISFHTLQQAEEFMSYPENVELVKQYYML